MQVFLALAGIVFAFAFGLGLMVIDRVEARAVRLARAAATDEATAIAALVESELERADVALERLAFGLENNRRANAGSEDLQPGGLEFLDPNGHLLFPVGGRSRAFEAGAVWVDVPLKSHDRPVGTVRVVKPTLVIESLLADIAPTVLVISLVLGAAAAGAAAWIGGTIAEPIETLSDFAEQVSDGRRPPLPSRVIGREVGRLVSSIDRMQRKLEGRPFVETFAADLSHELKNPVAALLASAEVLEDGALEEPEQARRFVQRIREAAERIEKLLAELLDLAAVETHSLEGKARFDMNLLVREALEGLGDPAQRIAFEPKEAAHVRGDAAWLGRAIQNLLQNGLLHSPEGSTVRVQVESNTERVLLRVENAGEVQPHVRRDLFRRFITTRRDRGGTGLGLSIVRAVAEAHGGQIDVASVGPPFVVFEFSIPRA